MTGAERFGANLRDWRLKRRLTQEQLGENIGSSGARVSRLETGSENPTLDTIDRLATAIGVDVSFFFLTREEEATHPPIRNHPGLEKLLGALDAEAPAENTWRGDVLKALAALNRALRREDPDETDESSPISGR